MEELKLSQGQYMLPACWLDAILHGEIKGKAKIYLKNERTGKTELIEHDNLVTNAVRNLFLYDYDRSQNFPKMLPIKELFGGILCFEDAFENPTANDILVPSESHNKFTACAGDEAHATANPYRGNPNAIASGISADGRILTQVWEWQTSQGNGKIGSLCLTSATAGNMGTIPFDDTYSPITTDCNNRDEGYFYPSNINYDDIAKQRAPFRVDGSNGQYGYSLSYDKSTGVLTEWKVEHPFLASGLTSEANTFVVRSTRTLSLNIDATHIYLGYEDGYYYFIAHDHTTGQDDKDDIYWKKISASTFTVVSSGSYIDLHALIYAETGGNAYTWIKAQSGAIERALPICDGYAYLPCHYISDNNAVEPYLVKIPLKDGESVSVVHSADGESTITIFNRTNYPSLGQDTDSLGLYPVKIGKGLVAGWGYMLNDGVLYKTANPIRPNGTVSGSGASSYIPHGFLCRRDNTFPSMHDSLWSQESNRATNNGFAYSNFYLATINNLEEQVEKTAIMSMRVEYILSALS